MHWMPIYFVILASFIFASYKYIIFFWFFFLLLVSFIRSVAVVVVGAFEFINSLASVHCTHCSIVCWPRIEMRNSSLSSVILLFLLFKILFCVFTYVFCDWSSIGGISDNNYMQWSKFFRRRILYEKYLSFGLL